MNPWIALGLVLAWIASLAGVGYWQNDAGHTTERVAWQARDNAALAEANSKLHDTEEKYRRIEQSHAADLAAISGNYQKELKDASQKTADLIAANRAGAFRLRDPGATACSPHRSILSETAASSGGRDGGTQAELSGTAAEFLLGLTGEADDTARQLSACQAIVKADRDVGD